MCHHILRLKTVKCSQFFWPIVHTKVTSLQRIARSKTSMSDKDSEKCTALLIS